MKYRVHYTYKLGGAGPGSETAQSYFDVEGSTTGEIGLKSAEELRKRGGVNPHSEKLED